ncbi:transketolase [Streptomyces botrytidirepellens]|uniref:Transketolase n=1 Tax=Streptomyces botrytidirepellens TaxID=2486417 RepID=A0A3M8VTC3_9ACTN|nr:transketolase [Streptomyces botrytidirepellens]RNG20710.1 transketolase [Streptomyces botrytidirepellens]
MTAVSCTTPPADRRRPTDADLGHLATRARELILRTAHQAGAGHVGGSLSAADLLVTLYFDELRIDPAHPGAPERDRFILSKGHCALGLYVALAMRGYFDTAELADFDQGGSRLQMHPDMTKLPGIEMSTGSLGQGLSAGVGMALGARLGGPGSHRDARTYVLLGDGELQEGMTWEAAHVAPRYQLGNLVAILDHNGLQQYGWPRGADDRGDRRDPWAGVDLRATFTGLGWRVLEIDGNDIAAIRAAFAEARRSEVTGPPTMILATTRKGRGVSFTEMTIRWHTGAPTEEQLAAALAELEGAHR